MLRSLALLILRNSTRAPLFAVLWARGYLSQHKVAPTIVRRRRPF